MKPTTKSIQKFAASVVVILGCSIHTSQSAASPPDVSGAYSGQLSGPIICGPDTGTQTTTYTITYAQSGTSITGSGGGTFNVVFPNTSDSGSFTIETDGTVDANGFSSGTQTGTVPDGTFTGTFSGNFSADGNSINITVQNTFSFGCTETLSGTLARAPAGSTVFNPEITPGSSITSILLTGIQVRAITSDVSGRVGNVLRGIGKSGAQPTSTGFRYQEDAGRNAGDSILGYGVWSSYSYSDFEDDFVATSFTGHRHSMLGGIDISLWENTILGIAVGYETSGLETRFNQGESDSDGFTVAPYFGILLSDNISFDFSGGYSRVSYDQFRTEPGTGQRITSKPDADRYFATMNASIFQSYGAWTLTGQTGMLYAKNSQNEFIESNGAQVAELSTTLGQFSLSGEAAYAWDAFEPFARVGYEHDFSRVDINILGGGPQPKNDNDNFLVGAGVRYYSANGITGNVEWNKRLGRSNFSEDVFILTLRGQF